MGLSTENNMFLVFLDELEEGMECTPSDFVADRKLQGVVNILDGFHSKRPGQAEKWTDRKLMKFKKSTIKDLCIGVASYTSIGLESCKQLCRKVLV